MEQLMGTWRLVLGLLGFALVIAGAVTAAYEETIAGFTPTLWALLGVGAFFGASLITLFRIEVRLEKKETVVIERQVPGTQTRAEKFCPNCGSRLPARASFCEQCGASMSDYVA